MYTKGSALFVARVKPLGQGIIRQAYSHFGVQKKGGRKTWKGKIIGFAFLIVLRIFFPFVLDQNLPISHCNENNENPS